MASEDLFESIKENLNGQPGQPILLGVCSALARRFDKEPWIFRAAAIVLGVFYTGLTLAVYVVLGLMMTETEARTRGVFQGLFISIRECVDKCIESCRGLLGAGEERDRSARY